MTHVTLALLPGLVLGIAFVCSLYSRWSLNRLHRYHVHARYFFEAAKPLLQDDDTPDEILKFLAFLNRRVVDQGGARALYRLLSSGQLDNLYANVPQEAHRMREFLAARPELEKPFVIAMVHALAAMTFLSPFYGPKVRRLMSMVRSKEDRENMAVAYETLSYDRDSRSGPLAAALC